MPVQDVGGAFSSSPHTRLALLEGRWLGRGASQAIVAFDPVSSFEGEAPAIGGLPDWLARHGEQYPEGGAIGFLAYELGRVFERLPLCPEPRLPDFHFAYYPRIEEKANRDWRVPFAPLPGGAEIVQGFDEGQFAADVERVREYIAAGDIYQANLTQQFIARLIDPAPESVYARLTRGQAPMRAFLKTPHATIMSDSPERFFQVRGDRILTSPIKGTLARSSDQAQDQRLRARLLSSKKDRAENVMIVDLLRNDLGRICRYETIQARLWQVDALPHLFHLVSHVEGALRPQTGPLEILRALFPCGSITGAPKIRAMEILAELEPSPRGISMGAIGIMRGVPGSRGFEMDFSVAIRTVTLRDDIATFNVGCGIVYDSEPKAEYEEMLLKARPLLEALQVGSPDGMGRVAKAVWNANQ